MKKLIVLVTVALFAFNAQAQDIKLGLKAGVNLTSLTGDDLDVDPRFSYHAGVVANVSFSDLVSLQPEVIYSSQGVNGETQGTDFTGKLDYIQVPIMVSLNLADGFSVHGGPQIGFNVTDKVEFESMFQTGTFNAKSVDLNLNLGLQYSFGSSLFLQLRYSYGIINIQENSDAKNSITALSIGYFFM